ncbi:MAG: T9SS type A sorting domain-containing protein, partial [Dysgonamonadaceae bacterium]|nr:T9SS type A sorting domain-containing protein [Dysgonamonadaceae bacterium]
LVNGKLTVTALSGIEDVVANQLRIFPNPAKEELFIKSDLPVKNVKIYTLSGDLLISEDNFNGKISVSALPAGVYLLKVHNG